uniref:Uncharacterized protein n=1 Tax=Nelumbo nucifera TaxID=4432 RepID=A0A822ZAK7_NELNU|nr:TPA_asm: hypothetical protein HUJ06_014994 [Nelumbo nucifera]
MRISWEGKVVKLKIEEAEYLYKRFMGFIEFFPHDIDRILRNNLSLGTWVVYPRGKSWDELRSVGLVPSSWAMVSVCNNGSIFKLRVGKAPLSCHIYSKSSRMMDRIFPCLRIPALSDVFHPFGFYFMYGVHGEGRRSDKLVPALCQFVHNMATECKDCKVIIMEVGVATQ